MIFIYTFSARGKCFDNNCGNSGKGYKMSKAVKALITPEVLAWARSLDAITQEEASRKLNVKEERIDEWEKGTSMPTLRQAKKLAKYYRVPFVYFYLPDIPKRIKRINKIDYRTFGNVGYVWKMSRELRWLLRDIEERRDVMLALYEAEGRSVQPFTYRMDQTANHVKMAGAIRALLEITFDKQIQFRRPEKFLSHCISKLEQKDFLIFQAAKIEPKEMRGLSLAYDLFPIITLNRKDEPSARLFTLIHELVHIITNTSGICNDISERSASDNNTELMCNDIAGLVLVPQNEFEAHQVISLIKKFGFDDNYVSAIARDFAVSKEVVLHRLWDMSIISKRMYYETLKRYNDEYMAYKSRKKGGFLPPALDKGTQVGRLYARTVLSSYYGDRISSRDASNYLLNLGQQHFGKIERWCY